jgi:surface protein
MKPNIDTKTIFKLVLVVCLVSLLVYLFWPKLSIPSVKRIQDKRKSIETTPDKDSGRSCNPNLGQLCPGGFDCPSNGKCPGCSTVINKLCLSDLSDKVKCINCINRNQLTLKNSLCSEEYVNSWCTYGMCKPMYLDKFKNSKEYDFINIYIENNDTLVFRNCVNDPNFLKNMGLTDLSKMFEKVDFTQFPELDISKWDTSSVTDMSYMFNEAKNIPDISGWDVRSVTDMKGMFEDANTFNRDISGWNTSNVTDMSYMFFNVPSFNQPIGKWNVRSVTDMSYMFDQAYKFNQPLGNWKVSSVTNMSNMFNNAQSFNGDIGGWDVRSVTDMSFMFAAANSFNQPIGNWKVDLVTDMSYMFYDATIFNQDLTKWNVGKVDNYKYMFGGSNNIWLIYKPTFSN